MATIKVCDTEETLVNVEEYSLSKAIDRLKKETIAVIGYGVQGAAQALNLRDNGLSVVVGQRSGTLSWDKAVSDGWEPGVNLFSIEKACQRSSFIAFLLSDAGQVQQWPIVKANLSEGNTLLFAHGFALIYKAMTQIVPPAPIDVILVAPKCSGHSVREHFVARKAINVSYAIFQDGSSRAKESVLSYAFAMGATNAFETTVNNEVLSDLTGERGVLIGALAGIMEAQYQVLRSNGHSPTEAFNETVEELTESLIPLISANGIDGLLSNCSTTAQRGALDWMPRFKAATLPLFDELYEAVKNGNEAKRVLEKNSQEHYTSELRDEINELNKREIWSVGKLLRRLRFYDKTV